MLVTDVGDDFGLFGHQHPLFFILVSGTNIQKMSPTLTNRHQHKDVSYITVTNLINSIQMPLKVWYKALEAKVAPNVGLEPTTVGLRVQRSTD